MIYRGHPFSALEILMSAWVQVSRAGFALLAGRHAEEGTREDDDVLLAEVCVLRSFR